VPGSAAATLAFIKLLSEKLARDTGIAIHWRAGIGRSSPVPDPDEQAAWVSRHAELLVRAM